MKNTITLLVALLMPGFAAAQNSGQNHCAQMLQKAQAALQKKEYTLARDYCEAALPLCPELVPQFEQVQDDVNRGIENEKTRARQEAENARRATIRAKAEAENARRALAKFESATSEVVFFLLETARSEVLRLEYENARATLLKAAALGQRKTEVAEALYEIAFVDYHIGYAARADSLTGYIATTLGVSKGAVLASFDVAASDGVTSSHAVTTRIDTLATAMHARYFGIMIPIEGGSFDLKEYDFSTLGGTFAYRATLAPFCLAATETSWWQYHLFCKATGYAVPEKPGWGGEGDNPVVNISWYDAVVYANWRSDKAGFEPAYQIDSTYKVDKERWVITPTWEGRAGAFRLPTEAEWQYAATNCGRDDFAFAGSDTLELVGWYSENSSERTRPVRGLQANALGLYDMSGNVWEWCWDQYGDYPSGPTSNWRGPYWGRIRVYRGGGWSSFAVNCRSVYRDYSGPTSVLVTVGFRLCSFALQ